MIEQSAASAAIHHSMTDEISFGENIDLMWKTNQWKAAITVGPPAVTSENNRIGVRNTRWISYSYRHFRLGVHIPWLLHALMQFEPM